MAFECGAISVYVNAFRRHPTEIGVRDFVRVYAFFEEGIKGKWGVFEVGLESFLPELLE